MTGAYCARWLALLGLMAQLVPDVARAQAPAPAVSADSSASDDVVYQRLIAEGLDEFDRGNWAEARHHFLDAHERRPTARTMRGLGIVAFELRHYVEAAGWLERALHSKVVPLTDRQRAEVEAALERAHGFVGRYTLALEPQRAEVRVDGEPLELNADGTLWLDVGEHELVVSATNYQSLARKLSVRGGKLEPLDLALRRPAPDLALGTPAQASAGKSVFEQWWFWSIAAVAIGGGASAAYLLTRDADVQPLIAGDDGVVVHALTIVR
jgi:hypothetical protein